MSSIAPAADCWYEKNLVDPFTKKEFIETEWEQMSKDVTDKYKHPKGFVSAIRDGDQLFLAIKIRTRDSYEFRRSNGPIPPDNVLFNAFVADEGSKLLLLLADETIIELATDRRVRGIANPVGPTSSRYSGNAWYETWDIRTTAALRYPLTAEAHAALTSFPVKNIRLSSNGRDHDFLLRKEPYGGINRAINCLNAGPAEGEGA